MAGEAMTFDEMKARVDEWIDAWNRGDLDEFMTLYDDDIVLHGYGPGPIDKTAVRAFYEKGIKAWPGSQIELLDTFGSGDRLVARYVQRGPHAGTMMGVPPSGRELELTGITIMVFHNGRVVERWAVADRLGLAIQVGAVPRLD